LSSPHLNEPHAAASLRLAQGASRAAFLADIDILRLATLLFLLPDALFALTLGPAAALPLLLGSGVAFAILWRPATEGLRALAEPVDFVALSLAFAVALALLLLGGETHLLYANADWLARDGVLHDLAERFYPIFYRYREQDYLLRAPLGMYMTPALVGRFLGLHAAHVALLAQNAALLASILYLLARLARPHSILVVLLFIAFSGLDIVPALVMAASRWLQEGVWPHIGHIEWWAGYVQYSSHVTQLFWAPNHALPGWQIGVLILLHARREIDFAALLAAFAPLLFWAPLPMVGALPALAFSGLAQPTRDLLAPRPLAAFLSGLCFLPMTFFLTRDAGDNPHRLLLGLPDYWLLYGLFLFVEIPQGLLLACNWDRIERCDRGALAASLAVLLILPAFEFGHSNDLAMRASIPPLFLLAFGFARLCASSLQSREKSRLDHAAFERNRSNADNVIDFNGLERALREKPVPTFSHRALALAAGAIVFLGAVTPGLEIARAFLPAFAISDCNFLTTWRKSAPKSNGANYLSRLESMPDWLVTRTGHPASERETIEDRRCWPDHPLLEEARK
jgi:hypothetical protein